MTTPFHASAYRGLSAAAEGRPEGYPAAQTAGRRKGYPSAAAPASRVQGQRPHRRLHVRWQARDDPDGRHLRRLIARTRGWS